MAATISTNAKFQPEVQAKFLRNAMKGLGTNEQQIRDVLATHSNEQRVVIAKQYKTAFGRDLFDDLKSELGGHFEDLCLALMTPAKDFDAVCLHNAISGPGTDEKCLVEILVSRSNSEMKAVKEAYKRLYKKDLERDIVDDTSGDFRHVLVSLVQAMRDEEGEVDQTRAQSEARELYDAGENMLGTDESVFNLILSKRSLHQLRATFDEYDKISDRSIEGAITSETSGWLKEAYLSLVQFVRNSADYFAERLNRSMRGAGTDDKTLIRLIVSRAEIDLKTIKDCYFRKYHVFLAKDVADDTSGDYKKLLLQLIGTD